MQALNEFEYYPDQFREQVQEHWQEFFMQMYTPLEILRNEELI